MKLEREGANWTSKVQSKQRKKKSFQFLYLIIMETKETFI